MTNTEKNNDILGFYKLGEIINELNFNLSFIKSNIIFFASPLDKNLLSYYSTSKGKPVETNLHVPFYFEPFDVIDTNDIITLLKERNLGLGIGISSEPIINGIYDFNTTQYLSYPVYNPDKNKFIQYCRYFDINISDEFKSSDDYYSVLLSELNYVYDGMLGLRNT